MCLKWFWLEIPSKSLPKLHLKMAKFELDRTFLQMVHFYIGNVPEVVWVGNVHQKVDQNGI